MRALDEDGLSRNTEKAQQDQIDDLSKRLSRAEESLRETEAKFRALFENGPIGVAYHRMIYDEAGKPVDYYFLDANQKYQELTGVNPVGKLATEAFPGLENDPAFDWMGVFGNVAKTGEEIRFQTYLTSNGRWYDCVGYQYMQDHFVAAFLEITDRKKIEESLEKSEVKHKAMIANIADVIVIIDQDGINRYKSPNIEKWFGWQPEDVVGTHAFDNVHPEDLPSVQTVFAEMLGNPGRSITTQCRYRCKDNNYKWIEATGVNLLSNPIINGLLLNYRDITERKQTEEKLVQSHDLLSKLARLVPGVIYQYRLFPDGSSTFPYASPGMNEIYEVAPEEVQDDASAVFGRLHPDDYENVANLIQESAQTLKTFYCEFRVILPRQGLRWRWSQAHPERMEDGGTLWHGIISDITERKQSEYDKEQLQVQLSQAQKIDSIGQLAGGVAHDFNNMLSVILGRTELALLRSDPANPFVGDLEEIRTAAKRSADLTRQLLTFARKQTVVPKELDLNQTVAGMLKMLQRLIGENIDLSWTPEAKLWAIKIDPSQLDQVIANLCVNARDAIAGVGKISIKAQNCTIAGSEQKSVSKIQPGDYVRLSVSDDGQGIDQEHLNQIFEPFFTTKKTGEGTGLGLSTVYGAVKQNHGFIDVVSELGQGTTFHIYLPRQQAGVKTTEEQTAKDLRQGTETILLVEDDQMLLRLVKTMLEKNGYTVLDASNIDTAISLAKEHSAAIHLLLSDVIMPDMNGKDLRDILLVIRPGLKVIFMSGYTADIIAQHGIIEEGTHILPKPISYEALTSKVWEVLDQD